MPRFALLALISVSVFAGGCATAPQPRAAASSSAPASKSISTSAATSAKPGITMSRLGIPAGAEVHDIARLDVIPRPVRQARPHYPVAFRTSRVSGEAVVDFVVGPDGAVYEARSIRETHPAFGEAAVEAVSQWVFTPGQKGGRVVWTHMQVPIVFQISQ